MAIKFASDTREVLLRLVRGLGYRRHALEGWLWFRARARVSDVFSRAHYQLSNDHVGRVFQVSTTILYLPNVSLKGEVLPAD